MSPNYCSNCGTELTSDSKFCSECGTEVGESTKATGAGTTIGQAETDISTEATDVDEDEDEKADTEEGIHVKHLTASFVMALVVGSLVALAFSNIGGSAILFFVTLGGVTYYLYDRKGSARSAIGSGLYITALWLPITPIMIYIPLMAGAEEGTARGTGQAIGSILGMFIWGFVFFLIGLVVFAIGYFVSRGVDDDA